MAAKAGNETELFIQLIKAFGGAEPTEQGLTDLWIALINAVTAGGGGGMGIVPPAGDLSGTVDDPIVSGIQGEPVSATPPTNHEALVYNGTEYVPTLLAQPATAVTGPAGFGTSPVVGTNTGHYALQDHGHGNPTFPGTAQLAPVDVVWGIDPFNQPVAISLSGPMTIDGVSVTSGMRVLIPHYNNIAGPQPQDGIWEVQAGAWIRPTDFPHGGTFTQAFVMVLGGQYRGGTLWACTSETTLTIDTDDQDWQNLAHQGDPGHVYMSDFLEPVDYNNPYTDPANARTAAEFALPLRSWWHAGTELFTRHGVIDWGETPLNEQDSGALVIGWAVSNASIGGPNPVNKAAKDGCLGNEAGEPGVRDVGLGADMTKLYSAFPQVFAQIVGGGGGTGFGPVWLRTPGGFDHMTLDGSFSPCGTGYMANAPEYLKTDNLVIRNFGPTPCPGVAAVTAGGSTLAAGGWEVICTNSGSLSTGGWAGTGYQGWADTGGTYTYTGGPTESQPSPGMQVITTAGQGIMVTPPDQVPSPPWGRNYYLRPVCQVQSANVTLPAAVNTITSITVASATPPNGFASTNGFLFVAATNASGEACLAKFSYSTCSGNVFGGVNFMQLGSTAGGTATITGGGTSGGSVLFNETPNYMTIASNYLDGAQPNMTPFTWSGTYVPYVFPNPVLPSSLGYLGTGMYLTGGPNAPAGFQAFSEKLDLNLQIVGCGNQIVFDGAKPPSGGLLSFEYSHFQLELMVPPGMNGIVVMNSAWPNHCWWDVGANYYPSFDAGGWWNAIQGVNTAANQITYQTTLGLTVAGGGNLVQILTGGVIPNGSWRSHNESGVPNGASGGAWVAGWLQQASLDPVPFLIDAGVNYPANAASTFCNMSGDMHMINGGVSKALPLNGIGQVNPGGGLVNSGGGSLTFATSSVNGCFSFNGITNDATLIGLAHSYSASKNPDNSVGPSFVRL